MEQFPLDPYPISGLPTPETSWGFRAVRHLRGVLAVLQISVLTGVARQASRAG